MASGATGDGMFHGVYGGCIPGDDLGGQHRPYHRNCSCALHNSVGTGHCSHVAKVSYRIRRSWSEGSMVALKSPASHGSSPCAASLSTVAQIAIKDAQSESSKS
ncbi:zinc finger, SWIM-type [Artemisia annua]|uniref:Zinc finger, SWIM-type n=1 Tax=Artemisia annua TaxID=35608 RepID=A0A2U1KDJ3_ARTAN|nr:zinc finger, SWIM-type [Artemisia annua]